MMGINSAAELIWKVLVGVCILYSIYVRHYSTHLILLRQNGQIMFGQWGAQKIGKITTDVSE